MPSFINHRGNRFTDRLETACHEPEGYHQELHGRIIVAYHRYLWKEIVPRPFISSPTRIQAPTTPPFNFNLKNDKERKEPEHGTIKLHRKLSPHQHRHYPALQVIWCNWSNQPLPLAAVLHRCTLLIQIPDLSIHRLNCFLGLRN